MRIRSAVVALALLGASPAHADTATLGHEYQPEKFSARERKIDPDVSVYGVPFGSTEAEVIEAFGAPRGVLLVNDFLKVFYYGRSHMFVFRKGKLAELNVSEHAFLRYDLARRMEDHPFFDSKQVEVAPGLRFGMTFDKVAKVLNKPDLAPDYRVTVDGENSTMTLNFSQMMGASGAGAYTLSGFSIRHYGR